MIYAIIGFLAVILDQYVKYWTAANILIDTGVKDLIPGIVSLVNIHNPGAAFGILSGSNSRILFISVCVVFTLLVIVAIAANWISGPLGKWCAVLVAAGGIGNCIDRVLYGYVQDMFSLDFINFPVFNVADIFITVFCLIFILYILFGGEGQRARDRREINAYGIEDEDEYEEETVPSRGRKGRTYETDDAGYEEDEPAPRRRTAREPEPEYEQPEPLTESRSKSFYSTVTGKPSKKDRQAAIDDEYEQFKAQRAERIRQMQEQEAKSGAAAVRIPQKPVEKAISPDDPFAEWERANSAAASAAEPSEPMYSAARAAEYAVPSPQPAAQTAPASPAYEAPAPAAEPVKKSTDSYDIDDILSEFGL